jgi:hypothetical protein
MKVMGLHQLSTTKFFLGFLQHLVEEVPLDPETDSHSVGVGKMGNCSSGCDRLANCLLLILPQKIRLGHQVLLTTLKENISITPMKKLKQTIYYFIPI